MPKSTEKNVLIEFKNISKSYGNRAIIEHLNLRIYEGEFLTILGPSGCGKTTLLRLLAGFETPSDGDLLFNDVSIVTTPSRLRPFHTVFQNYALFPHMSVYNNIAFPLKCQNVDKEGIKSRVQEVLKMVRMQNYANHKPMELSGGQQQRVALARAIINRPKLLLLDECLSALDSRLRKSMQVELKQIQRQLNITFIFITHSQDEALSMSDRVVVLSKKGIEQVGTPKEIYETPRNLHVAKFIGDANILEATLIEKANNNLKVQVENIVFTTKASIKLGQNTSLHLILRPEDLRVWRECEDNASRFKGIIDTVIYKGSTIDLIIKLTSGQTLLASEFFNEDEDISDYQAGQTVYIDWPLGWEVILPYER